MLMQTKEKVRIQTYKQEEIKNEKTGAPVIFAMVSIIDEDGEVFKMSTNFEECKWLEEAVPCEGMAEIRITEETNQKTKTKYKKMKLMDFTNE
jgi:hypothetical protein